MRLVLKAQMLMLDNTCIYCGCEFNKCEHTRVTRDHLYPTKHRLGISLDGYSVPACLWCNRKRGDTKLNLFIDTHHPVRQAIIYQNIEKCIEVNHMHHSVHAEMAALYNELYSNDMKDNDTTE